MCILHDLNLHHVFQNIMEALERSKMVSPLFLKRVGYLLCTCSIDIYFESKSLIATQRSLYKWFTESLNDTTKDSIAIERLHCFKQIIEELKDNGNVDSGTKIAFMNLLKDLDSNNFSKLRFLNNKNKMNSSKPMFYSKLVKIKFDLKLCSAKEFCELINKIDNEAIKYIQIMNKCKIVIRDAQTLSIRHFMGEIDTTIEAHNEKFLFKSELSLKRLADAVHYRLAKQIPSGDTILSSCSLTNLKVLLQSPPQSFSKTPKDDSYYSSTTNENSYYSQC